MNSEEDAHLICNTKESRKYHMTGQHGIAGKIIYFKEKIMMGGRRPSAIFNPSTEQSDVIEEEQKLDPLELIESRISGEYYSIVWCALKKGIWDDKQVWGIPISLTKADYKWLFFEFFFFTFLMFLTVNILSYESIKNERLFILSKHLELLRLILVCFSQVCLYPEFYRGWVKMFYAFDNQNEFTHPKLAILIGFQQLLISVACYMCGIIYIVSIESPFEMIMSFVDVTVLIEIDDWLGAMILQEFPPMDKNVPQGVDDISNLNEELTINSKLALLREDLVIINDNNLTSRFAKVAVAISRYIPSYIISVVSLYGFEYLLRRFDAYQRLNN